VKCFWVPKDPARTSLVLLLDKPLPVVGSGADRIGARIAGYAGERGGSKRVGTRIEMRRSSLLANYREAAYTPHFDEYKKGELDEGAPPIRLRPANWMRAGEWRAVKLKEDHDTWDWITYGSEAKGFSWAYHCFLPDRIRVDEISGEDGERPGKYSWQAPGRMWRRVDRMFATPEAAQLDAMQHYEIEARKELSRVRRVIKELEASISNDTTPTAE
jgi:hypothetical protein